MHGKGVYVWADGRKYEGEYVNDKKDGYGIYTWADGRKYQGYWSNGKQHGKGKYIATDGTIKWGVWEDGKRVKWIEPENDEEAFRYRDGSKVTSPFPEMPVKKDASLSTPPNRNETGNSNFASSGH
jgi:Uncharacterized protein conserved in bacteria